MPRLVERLNDVVRAVAPIHGVAIGSASDKRTWRIDFTSEATTQERTAAASVFSSFDPDAVPPQSVKDEARRRILARYPDWKQANMTAHGVELVNIRVSIGSWTQQQTQEAADLSAAWDWVKAVRRASDALEATTPIPADYTNDKWWPKQ